MEVPSILKGVLTWVPGVMTLWGKGRTRGTDSARYCYGVWLKHLTMLWAHGYRVIPEVVAELGPGDSLGTGLAALLSGARRYFALDIVPYSEAERSIKILDELIELFRTRAPRPTKGWPDFDEYLDDRLFPSHILPDELLNQTLDPRRLDEIRELLRDPTRSAEAVEVRYVAPWTDDRVLPEESVDVVLSHSVLEHVEDLNGAYRAMAHWLKPGGVMTHQIDFTSHGLTPEWNGYRKWSESTWRLVMGRRQYLINRQPCSVHHDLLFRYGFEVSVDMRRHDPGSIARASLAPRWQSLSDEDLSCSGCFIQARKPAVR